MNYSEQELTKKQNMLLDTRIKWKNRLRVSSRIAVIVLFLGGAGVLTGKMCGRLGVNPTGIFQKIVSLSAGQLLGAGMVILVIGLTVSYQCSIKILEKKEY